MFKKQRHNKKLGVGGRFLLSVAACFCWIILISVILAEVCNLSENPTGLIGICSLAGLIISAVASGISTAIIMKDLSALKRLTVGIVSVLIMISVCLISQGGGVNASAFMNYGCFIGAFILSTLLFRKKERHGYKIR